MSLAKSAINLLGQKERLLTARQEVDRLKAENEALEKEYREKTSAFYLEEVIRGKLNMGKQGEVVVIIPEAELAAATAGAEILGTGTQETSGDAKPVWRHWLEVLF